MCRGLLVPVAALSCAASAFAGESCQCWNAAADFSSAQGANDWWYGYREAGGRLQVMTEYDVFADAWSVDWAPPAPLYWTVLRHDFMHPNGLTGTGGRTPADHEVVLRWISPVDSPVSVVGFAAKSDTTCGNGVDWSIQHNGETIHTFFIAFNDGTGHDFDLQLDVAVGDTIDFALNAHEAMENCDSTNYAATIFTPAWAPAPADLDLSCAVGVNDLLQLLAAWGDCADVEDCPADLDDDNTVGVADLLELLSAWGPCE